MAEIEIEKKKPVWPWIILVIIILALLYFLVFANDNKKDMKDNNTEMVADSTDWDQDSDTTVWKTETDSMNSNEGVSGYLDYVNERSNRDHMEYPENAMLKLVDAVEAKAYEMNYDLGNDRDELQNHVQELSKTTADDSKELKDTGEKVADVLKGMQEEKYPSLSNAVKELKTSAQNIEADTETTQQNEKLNAFFEKAADVLKKMS